MGKARLSQGAWRSNKLAAAAIALFVLVVALASAYLSAFTAPIASRIPHQVYGLLAVGLLYAVASAVKKTVNPLKLVLGKDGRPSTSQFQFFLWSAVVAFGYVTYLADRIQHGGAMNLASDFPQNVLTTLGFSVATFAGARGITVGYLKARTISKTPGSVGGLVSDDTGNPDLSKIQLLMWTVIGAIIFMYRVGNADPLCNPAPTVHCIPDIDGALMSLMGLGHGAYLGTKLASMDTVGASNADPNAVVPNQISVANPPPSLVQYHHQCGQNLCWAACVQMVAEHFDKQSTVTQCMLAETFTGYAPGGGLPDIPTGGCGVNGSCACPVPAPCDYELDTKHVPEIFAQLHIATTSLGRPPNANDEQAIRSELDAKRPVQVEYQWSNSTRHHVAVISNYSAESGWYEVTDPYYGVVHIDFGEILSAYSWGAAGNYWTFSA